MDPHWIIKSKRRAVLHANKTCQRKKKKKELRFIVQGRSILSNCSMELLLYWGSLAPFIPCLSPWVWVEFTTMPICSGKMLSWQTQSNVICWQSVNLPLSFHWIDHNKYGLVVFSWVCIRKQTNHYTTPLRFQLSSRTLGIGSFMCSFKMEALLLNLDVVAVKFWMLLRGRTSIITDGHK